MSEHPLYEVRPARLSAEEAAHYLNLGYNATLRLLRTGELIGVKHSRGGGWKVSIVELDAYIARLDAARRQELMRKPSEAVAS